MTKNNMLLINSNNGTLGYERLYSDASVFYKKPEYVSKIS